VSKQGFPISFNALVFNENIEKGKVAETEINTAIWLHNVQVKG
jgi:hypothetical protein